jgi:hypothetical protein
MTLLFYSIGNESLPGIKRGGGGGGVGLTIHLPSSA